MNKKFKNILLNEESDKDIIETLFYDLKSELNKYKITLTKLTDELDKYKQSNYKHITLINKKINEIESYMKDMKSKVLNSFM